ncbi:MAG: hypothetical protein J6X70_02080 [Muribaculaceae bacterium]|nr:hypothetical protein [Muribaculaceae bacterium]
MNTLFRYYITLMLAALAAFAAFTARAADNVPGQEVTVVGDENYSNAEVLVYDGIDVSSYQHDIDWTSTAKDKNIQFVYIKATEGATHVSRHYRRNIEHARAQGVKVGAYHFFRTTSSLKSQFDNFTRVVKVEEQDLLPLIDVETCKGWSAQQLRDSVKVFADMLEAHYGCRPMIYASSSFFNSYLGATFADYPLFIARYAQSEPRLNYGAKWILWQFTDRGRIKGIDTMVDLSRFNKGCDVNNILISGKKNNKRRRGGRQETVPPPPPKPKKVEQREVPATSKKQREKAEKERKEAEKRAEKERKEAEKRAEKERKEAEKRAHEQAERERKQAEKERKEAEKQAERERKQAEKERKEELEREREIARQHSNEQTEQEQDQKQDQQAQSPGTQNPQQTDEGSKTTTPAKPSPEAPYSKTKNSKSTFKRVNKNSTDNDNVDYPTKRNK